MFGNSGYHFGKQVSVFPGGARATQKLEIAEEEQALLGAGAGHIESFPVENKAQVAPGSHCGITDYLIFAALKAVHRIDADIELTQPIFATCCGR